MKVTFTQNKYWESVSHTSRPVVDITGGEERGDKQGVGLRRRLWGHGILFGWCRDGRSKGAGLHADLVEGCVELG